MRRLALLALIGCGSSDLAPEGPAVPYELTTRLRLPFPTDAVTEPAPERPTGLRIALGPKGSNLGDVDEALFLLGEAFIETLGRADGWSTLGPAFIELPEPVTSESVAFAKLIDLASKKEVATHNTLIGGQTEYGKEVHWIALRPLRPLAPKTRHALILTKNAMTPDGRPLTRSPTFDAVWTSKTPERAEPEQLRRAQNRLAGVAEALSGLVHADDILVAETYTTLSIVEETEAILNAQAALPDPEILWDADDNGEPDIYLDPRADPRGNVPRADYSGVRALIRARFQLPNYRDDLDGSFVVNAQTAELQGWEDVELILTIPEGPGPFPVVVFHHGVGDQKESGLDFAGDLARRGLALVAIDGALHGFRTDRPGNAATRFLNVVAPELVADNFRQAQTDQAYFARVIQQMGNRDFFGDGPRLDTSKVFYLGESLGAIVGAGAVGMVADYQGAVLMVGGGTLLEFFDRVLSSFEFTGFPTQLFSTAAQTALDRGDPSNWAWASQNKQILLVQAMDDVVVPAAASQSLALAMDLPLLAPGSRPHPALPILSGPLTRRGWSQFAPGSHALFRHASETHHQSAKNQVFHFIETWAATGTAEVR